ncbi:SDR family oxidoreductase [Haloechinothrix sp. YIM 98757]|uniref:SDR family oxidoreductase n=1 Tax=Haloechinothrix aidingensis TaxID=2752311 RepID=A0A837ZV34_9PSEU|nr:SDR family oxidoreductase [Haloechinothrix aidingensis]MBA0124486.1 SDR family oxidoreductase [Haloechinothrix aidingensis]
MARQPRSLVGRTIAITGGARGIGAATASMLAGQGARVAIGDLDGDLAEQTAASLRTPSLGVALDVTDTEAYTAFLDRVESELGPVDVLINNAGIMPIGPIDEETDSTTTNQLAINLHAVIHGSKEAVRRMKRRGGGHIVNIASAAGKSPVPSAATYSATKFGVVGFSESLRLEVAGDGIDVSCVMPGIVRTELSSGLKDTAGFPPVQPEDVAEAIVGALQRPRFDVFVPASIGPISRLSYLMPRRFGDWLVRRIGVDRLMAEAATSQERASYEARVADSAPAAGRGKKSKASGKSRTG